VSLQTIVIGTSLSAVSDGIVRTGVAAARAACRLVPRPSARPRSGRGRFRPDRRGRALPLSRYSFGKPTSITSFQPPSFWCLQAVM
jgi:hypothetical protein